jgi:glucose-1-phosphate cytidylyltransferase
MKVVLFCGGYGMRMRDVDSNLPKPMVSVGPRPLLWHIMRYYAHFGHTEFVLCLGYGAQHIKNYFLNYQETESNDFVMNRGRVALRGSDIQDWTIEFVHTGRDSTIGERLRRVRHHVEGEEMFLANYADVLTDAPLDEMIRRFVSADAGASLLAVPPQSAFHCVELGAESTVESIVAINTMPIWENGGYFILRPEVFDHIPEGGDLVGDGLTELTKRGRLLAYPHRGFWHPADTLKERAALDAAYDAGRCPWMLWEDNPALPDERPVPVFAIAR